MAGCRGRRTFMPDNDHMFDSLFAYMSSLADLNKQDRQLLQNYFTFRQAPRNFTLVREGMVARELYFINKGLLRLYYNKDGQDITAFIFREHLFATSYESFLKQSPGIQWLETLEDADLLVLSFEDMQELYRVWPPMNVLTRKIAEQRFINAQAILSSYILDSPEERYRKFEAQHGDLLLRVPHFMIASFLGITPVSLSRIRKRIMK